MTVSETHHNTYQCTYALKAFKVTLEMFEIELSKCIKHFTNEYDLQYL